MVIRVSLASAGESTGAAKALRIATVNVNGIRAAYKRGMADWLAERDIDILCLQEVRAPDAVVRELLGDEWFILHAEAEAKGRAGVAIASRVGLDDVERTFPGQPSFGKTEATTATEARAIGATCNGVRVWSLYVPNGRAVGDPHMPYKLQWLDILKDQAAGWIKDNPDLQLALMGDWNIAPQDDDVWDIDWFRAQNATHITEPERAAFQAFLDAGLTDVVRPYTPGPGVYTYWDYTQLRFPKKEGMRIDFVLGSPALAARVTGASIDREERKGKGASDHAPVIVELD